MVADPTIVSAYIAAGASMGLPVEPSQADDAVSWWLIAGAAAQLIVTLCFLTQFVSFMRGGRIIIAKSTIALGMVATVVVLCYAVDQAQWILALAQATNFVVGVQLIKWHRRTGGKTAAFRRPSMPVVAPHFAEPKSGIVSPPRPGTEETPR